MKSDERANVIVLDLIFEFGLLAVAVNKRIGKNDRPENYLEILRAMPHNTLRS